MGPEKWNTLSKVTQLSRGRTRKLTGLCLKVKCLSSACLINHNAQCCALRVIAPRAELGKAWSLTIREDQRLHCVLRVKRIFLIQAALFTVFQPHCSPFGSLSLPQGLYELDWYLPRSSFDCLLQGGLKVLFWKSILSHPHWIIVVIFFLLMYSTICGYLLKLVILLLQGMGHFYFVHLGTTSPNETPVMNKSEINLLSNKIQRVWRSGLILYEPPESTFEHMTSKEATTSG